MSRRREIAELHQRIVRAPQAAVDRALQGAAGIEAAVRAMDHADFGEVGPPFSDTRRLQLLNAVRRTAELPELSNLPEWPAVDVSLPK